MHVMLKQMQANKKEILYWCLYTKVSKSMYKDFMINNKVGEKKVKRQVYDFIIEGFPNTKHKTLWR